MPFADDPSSVPDEVLLVRVLRDNTWWHPREAPARASSLAFFESNGENSLFILQEADINQLRGLFEGVKFASVRAGDARECGYGVCRDEEGASGLPGHVLVFPIGTISMTEYRKNAQCLAKRSKMFDLAHRLSSE